jgi:hypothetical protein
MGLEVHLSKKRVLYIPIVSMRSYETGEYNLAADGNVNRFLSKFSMANSVDLTITLPINIINFDFITSIFNQFKDFKVNYIYTSCYGKNANETRKNILWINFLNSLDLTKFDTIIFEPNIIGTYNFSKSNKIIYWCPVSNTSEREISFVNEFAKLDKQTANKYMTYVCTKTQQEFLGKNSIIDTKIMIPHLFANLPKRKLFFIPFRQSDKGYYITEIYTILKKLEDEFDFEVIYTAPNGFVNDIKLKNMRQVPSDRDTYYSILARQPCIPFLEDNKNILHMSLFEFDYFKCKVIGFKNDLIKFKYELVDISQLKKYILLYLTE